jgi:hypothetical protein
MNIFGHISWMALACSYFLFVLRKINISVDLLAGFGFGKDQENCYTFFGFVFRSFRSDPVPVYEEKKITS